MKTGKFLSATVLNLSLVLSAAAQAPAPSSPSQSPAPSSSPAPSTKTFSQQELEQLLAPVALYPDALLAQVLMASTYPLEIVEAERWVKANPKLKDQALQDALQQQSWDPSVKSLTVVPQVLTMMSEKIDWTQKLGDAFLAQQKDVMATAQKLRSKAVAEGTLKDSKEQKIVTETTDSTTVIKIEPTNPEVVYVPTYNPTVVYGAWPYPAYPPYYYYPPGYVAGGMFFSFTAGAIVGGALWGDCNWGRGDVNVNVNKYNNFNRTNISNANWSHRAEHRGAVPYRDKAVAQQYGQRQATNAASRDQFRGRAEAGQSAIQRGDVSRDFGGSSAGRSGTATDRGTAGRDAGGRSSAASSLDSRAATRDTSAFDVGSGAHTRDISNRGASSVGSARSHGNVGGGGFRGGGGGGGGFRGGGGRGR